MPMPPSVTKIDKNGVTFTSSVNQTEYLLTELSRAALKESGKFLRREVKRLVPVRGGALKENIGTWVRKHKGTGELSLRIGIYSPKKSKEKGKRIAPHSHLVQLGTGERISKKTGKSSGSMPAHPFLDVAVESNIDTIREIQGKYLSAIEVAERAVSLIDEDEEIGDD